MSEPIHPGPAPEPFSPSTVRSTPGGCSRPAWIGCAVVILLLGVAALVFIMKAGDLFGWAMSRFEAQVLEVLDEDVSAAERERLREAFRAATEAVQEGRTDPMALQKLQEQLATSLTDESNTLSREQVEELTTALESVAQQSPRNGDPPALGE